jgi:hypothetical protein
MSDPAHEIAQVQWEAAKAGIVSMWSVYDRPTDYPDGFIARRFEVPALGPPTATDHTLTGELNEIRKTFYRAGLFRLDRNPEDEPQIVETWL